jgi:ubiquinol-cytochrome c reductase cytochrome b subunit
MVLAIIILFILPFIDKSIFKTPRIRILHCFFSILFFMNFIFLGFLGGSPADDPFIFFSRVASILYSLYFIFFIPFLIFIELQLNKKYFL